MERRKKKNDNNIDNSFLMGIFFRKWMKSPVSLGPFKNQSRSLFLQRFGTKKSMELEVDLMLDCV